MKRIRLIKVERNCTKNKSTKYLAYFEIDLNDLDKEMYVMGFNSSVVFDDYNTEDEDHRHYQAIEFLIYKCEKELRENDDYKYLFND